MPKYTLALFRFMSNGWHRQEIGTFLAQAAELAKEHPLIEDIHNVPVQMCPTPSARNWAIQYCQQKKVDYAIFVDDDTAPHLGFLPRAIDFLFKHDGPAAIGSPYCQGPPREEVNVFEWGTAETGTVQPSFALVNIVREDAARRTGIERVANIGTGCIVYDVRCFDKIARPYFEYTYSDESHAEVIETEECRCHRRLWEKHVPIYCDWNSWAMHWKSKRVEKPRVISEEQALALIKQQVAGHERYGKKTVRPADSPPVQKHATPDDIIHAAHDSPSNGKHEANGDTVKADEAYARNCMMTAPRPKGMVPQNTPFLTWPATLDSDVSACNFALSIHGWMHPTELEWLADQAARLRPHDEWVEVGTWRGRSWAATVLAATEGARVWAIDTWDSVPAESVQACRDSGDDPAQVFEEFRHTYAEVARLRPGVDLQVAREPSVVAARRFAEGSLAVVFLDADHSENGFIHDLEAWLPKVKPGGLLCGHDDTWPGVKAALAAAPFAADVQRGPGSIWYYRVPVPQSAAVA